MSTITDTPDQRPALSTPEFIALIAMLMATIAFSIDAMLPALPQIGAELSPGNVNRAQLVITSFVLGMGIGTLVTGPLSDRFGRKPVMIGGAVVYALAAFVAWQAQSPRVVAVALIRDLYSGREMARITSFAMMVFALVPALAPSLGKLIIDATGWRAIYLAFILFAALSILWLGLRQPETLPVDRRRAINGGAFLDAIREMAAHPTVRLSIAVQVLSFGMLFATLSSTQQIFDLTYGQGTVFHLWFGGIAVLAASASFVNARLVMRLGMRALIKAMLSVQVGMSALMAAVILTGLAGEAELYVYALWTVSVFFQAGLTLGNLNALGMEPMGHIAGMAASIMASIGTIGAVLIAVPIGLAFDGTALPLALGTFVCAVLALALTTRIKRDPA